MTTEGQGGLEADVSARLNALEHSHIERCLAYERGRGRDPGPPAGYARWLGPWVQEEVSRRFDIPPRYRRWRLADFAPVAQRRVAAFLADPAVGTLYLSGAPGSKKTSLACAALRAWRLTGQWWRPGPDVPDWGIFLPAYDLACKLRDLAGASHFMDEWADTAMLVLDDLGSNRGTPYLAEQILFLLEQRYDSRAKTVLTSNLTLEGLAEHLDPRAASRLQEGIVLDLGDRDWRADGPAAGAVRPGPSRFPRGSASPGP